MSTECVNSLLGRFARKFLYKFLLQFCSCLAAQQLYVVWPTGLGNFNKNFLANVATKLLTHSV